ncbi:MAG: TPM domain-containing protein [Elainella sp. Prado103]|nr:TPM domain-containing protein [Elainella sp. Prado103]
MVKRLPLSGNGRIAINHLLSLSFGVLICLQVWLSGQPAAHATGVYSMPTLTAGNPTWVIDQAETLSRITRNQLTGKLEKLAEQTGAEVRFVTIHRLDYGETIDDFAGKLFQKWFPSPEDQAQQVLLVLDNVTNTTAIRTGSAVKSLLSDEIATSVAQETVMVPLREGNKYNQSLVDASERLVAVLTGEPDPGPPIVADSVQTEGTFARAEETDDRSATIIVVVLLVLATVIPMATYYFYQQS